MKSRATAFVLAAVLALAALLLVFDNPGIDDTSRGDNYPCLAPHDTVLNNGSNIPGGETPPDADDIATRCDKAGRHRFNFAVALGAAAILAGGYAVTLTVFRFRSTKQG